MKRLLSSTVLALATLVAGAAQADNYTAYMTVSGIEAIGDEFVVYTTGVTNNGTNNPASCSSGVGRYYFHTASTTAAGRELMTRTLLAAFLAGKKIEVNVKTGSGACFNNYPTFNQLALSSSE